MEKIRLFKPSVGIEEITAIKDVFNRSWLGYGPLVKKFEGEFPEKYFLDVMKYLDMDPDYFRYELADKFRSEHLWANVNGVWKLRHTVNKDGVDD